MSIKSVSVLGVSLMGIVKDSPDTSLITGTSDADADAPTHKEIPVKARGLSPVLSFLLPGAVKELR